MNKKLLLLGILLALLLAIPLTLYLVTNQTKTATHANKSSTLSFSQLNAPVTVGQKFKLDVILDPGQNQVSFAKLVISYNSQVLKRDDPGISVDTQNGPLPVILEGPTYQDATCPGNTCTMTVTLSIGTQVTKAIQGGSPATIASVNFVALAPTDNGGSATVSFANGTQVLSLASTDQPSENVLASANATQITITGTGPTGTPTPTTTQTTGGGGTTTTTTTTTGGSTTITTNTGGTTTSGSANQPPVCSSLTTDNSSSPTTPFPVLFTATGTDTNGTISKVAFNFGDGSVQDVTSAGGIGTNSVNSQISHTYQSAGTYTASAVLTDNNGATSTPSTCSQTITVGQTAAATPTSAPVTTTKGGIPATGPGQTILTVGGIGAVITTIGAFLIFAL